MDNVIEIIQCRIADAADAYGFKTEADTPEGKLRDLLGDLRHYADSYGLDFAAVDRDAHEVYLSELGDSWKSA